MPAISSDLAQRWAAELWGFAATATALPGEHDDNFLLTSGAGERRVLKVMAAHREASLVELQCAALAHLAARAPQLALPRPVPVGLGERAAQPFAVLRDPAGADRLVWLLTFVAGRPLAEARPKSPALLASLGGFLGRMDAALADFTHPAAERELKWDLARAGWIAVHLDAIVDAERRRWVVRFLELWQAEVLPALEALPKSVIHGDANDHNVLVAAPQAGAQNVASVIDFGDMHHSITVAELAVATAYAIFGERDPLAAAMQMATGYHRARPMSAAEIAVLFPLIGMRLAVSVVNSALMQHDKPDDPYVTISEAPAWAALERLAAIHPRFAHYALRHACGLPPVPQGPQIVAWLEERCDSFVPVTPHDLRTEPLAVLDLSVGSPLLGADPAAVETAALERTIWNEMQLAGAQVGLGRYDEPRMLYSSPAFAHAHSTGGHLTEERRTVHLGIDLFVAAGEPVRAPLAGTVELVADNAAAKDYGPLVVLRHQTDDGTPFFALYGHLDPEVLARLQAGQEVAAGERIAFVGAPPANGDWPPHPHVQLILDLLELGRDFPGVAYASQREIWTALSPDPSALLGLPPERRPPPDPKLEIEPQLAARRRLIGSSQRLSYQRPLEIVRGWGCYLFDRSGRAYLDLYNNVPHVGHSHPRVVAAVNRQLALLNTNTRYLHPNILRYAERLTALLPAPLAVCFFVNSGSEANELALRLARTATGGRDLIVLDAAYHGHTTTLIDVSPYKSNGPGGAGSPPWVHVAAMPDDYRGPHRRDDPQAGERYADSVRRLADEILRRGGRLAGFLAETLPSVGGQIVPPSGYLAAAYRHVRAAGGLAIADEVQVGFGRLGSHFWGFELHDAVPDIVVLGKPIGNGFPLAAVVTTPEIAAAFDNGMEFFSTFGGNPVACAAGLAVLDVLREEGLQENARAVGERLRAGLMELAQRHALIGDVRGAGLFLGLELVRDRETLAPAAEEASYVVNRLRERGILTGTDGPLHNVIKIRPPMVISAADADFFLAVLDEVLGEDFVRAPQG